MSRQKMFGCSISLLASLSLFWALDVHAQSADAAPQDALSNLAEALVELRSDIETLNAELTDLTEQHRAQMASLAAQRGELEASKRREDLRIRELEEDLEGNKERAAEAGVASEALIPVAENAIARLMTHIDGGFPFKQAERRMAVENLQDQLATGAVSPARVVNRLWSFYEDELRLSRENGLYSQTIELEGESVLADVAKLGVVAMYFETRDGRLGYATQTNGDWEFIEASGGGQRQQIRSLFDSLRKQIRAGLFELPNGSIQLGEGA